MPGLNALFIGGLIAYLAGAAAGIAGLRAPRRARIGAFGCALAGAGLEDRARKFGSHPKNPGYYRFFRNAAAGINAFRFVSIRHLFRKSGATTLHEYFA